MATTYDKIATTTLTGTQSTISFTNISQAYSDLVIVIQAKATNSGDIYMRINGDTSNKYSYNVLSASGAGTSLNRSNGQNSTGCLLDSYGAPSIDNNHIAICNIIGYSNTSTFKTVISRTSNPLTAYVGTDLVASQYGSTSAVSSLELRLVSESFMSGTIVTLYGILKA